MNSNVKANHIQDKEWIANQLHYLGLMSFVVKGGLYSMSASTAGPELLSPYITFQLPMMPKNRPRGFSQSARADPRGAGGGVWSDEGGSHP